MDNQQHILPFFILFPNPRCCIAYLGVSVWGEDQTGGVVAGVCWLADAAAAAFFFGVNDAALLSAPMSDCLWPICHTVVTTLNRHMAPTHNVI